MRQVPQSKMQFLVIGNGKLAKHLLQYFQLLGLTHDQWHRNESTETLKLKTQKADRILLCISDSQIESFFQSQIEIFQDKVCIHFSGCLNVPGIFSVHPLMSFSERLFNLEEYKSISFNVFDNTYNLENLLPGLPNPSLQIDPDLKGIYHAHCAVMGNLPQILWSESQKFWDKIGIDFSQLENYIVQSFRNVAEKKEFGISGPISRNDKQTMDRNISDLKESKLSEAYTFFQHFYSQRISENEKH